MRSQNNVPLPLQKWIDQLSAEDAKSVANWLDENSSADYEMIANLCERLEELGEEWD